MAATDDMCLNHTFSEIKELRERLEGLSQDGLFFVGKYKINPYFCAQIKQRHGSTKEVERSILDSLFHFHRRSAHRHLRSLPLPYTDHSLCDPVFCEGNGYHLNRRFVRF